MIGEPRVVAAGRGAAWWRDGFRLFRAGLWTWIGIVVVYSIIVVLINLIPVVGPVGQWLLTPVFIGGVMIGCQELERGNKLRVAHLFEGFQGAHFVPHMIIGAVNIGLALGIGALAVVSVLGAINFAEMAKSSLTNDPLSLFMNAAATVTATGLVATVLLLVVATIFVMINWAAPALVALRGVSAIEAMKLSFVACLRNWLPFLVYGLIGAGLGAAGTVAFGIAAIAIGASAIAGDGGVGAMIGLIVLFVAFVVVVLLLIGPVVYGSIYESYKDTLGDDDRTLGNPAYQ